MLLICCFLIERLLTFTLECFPWLSCYVNQCFCLPQCLFRTRALGCDVTATECLFKKDKINWVNVNWPFSSGLSCTSFAGGRKCQQICEYICLPCLCWWATVTHLEPVWPFASSRAQSHADAEPACSSLSLSSVCVSSLWNPWVTEKWCELWLLSGCSARESIHCLALCNGCQSVSLSICHLKREQKELK